MRIGVLEPSQKPSESPRRHIKKSAAQSLLRRALAVQLARNLIQLLAVKAAPDSDSARFLMADFGPVVVIGGEVPALKPPRAPEGLLLHYPIKDQTSYQHHVQAQEI